MRASRSLYSIDAAPSLTNLGCGRKTPNWLTSNAGAIAISSVGLPWTQGQIRQDRYYAAHLLGDLKDPRAIPILVPLLTDPDVNYIVPWSLAQIGNGSAIQPLIGALSDPNPSIRVLAIYALVDLKATEALPRLRQLVGDAEKSNFGELESVAHAAQAAIGKLQ